MHFLYYFYLLLFLFFSIFIFYYFYPLFIISKIIFIFIFIFIILSYPPPYYQYQARCIAAGIESGIFFPGVFWRARAPKHILEAGAVLGKMSPMYRKFRDFFVKCILYKIHFLRYSRILKGPAQNKKKLNKMDSCKKPKIREIFNKMGKKNKRCISYFALGFIYASVLWVLFALLNRPAWY